MRKLLAVASAVLLFQTASAALAADVSFSINVGGPPIVISQPPDFLYPPELGFGVAVGVPYDMFYLSGGYYIYRGADGTVHPLMAADGKGCGTGNSLPNSADTRLGKSINSATGNIAPMRTTEVTTEGNTSALEGKVVKTTVI